MCRRKSLCKRLSDLSDASSSLKESLPNKQDAKLLSSSARRVLKTHFGYDAFLGRQEAIIEHALQGKHSLVLMPTGGGKSLCFQIPGLIFADRIPIDEKPLTLVLSPLVALMKDQVDALQRKGIEATFVNSSLNAETRINATKRSPPENGSSCT